jgi:citrate lyase gamma subunit
MLTETVEESFVVFIYRCAVESGVASLKVGEQVYMIHYNPEVQTDGVKVRIVSIFGQQFYDKLEQIVTDEAVKVLVHASWKRASCHLLRCTAKARIEDGVRVMFELKYTKERYDPALFWRNYMMKERFQSNSLTTIA